MRRLPVAVVGATGYSGEELARLLSRHPEVELTALVSQQHAGKRFGEVLPYLPEDLACRKLEHLTPEEIASRAKVVFLALPPGVSSRWGSVLRGSGCVVLDLGPDFRLKDPGLYPRYYGWEHPFSELLEQALYALPELRRKLIPSFDLLALPGCYPTGVLLSLVPLVEKDLVVPGSVVILGLSGVSGAGRKLEARLLFGEMVGNSYAYGFPQHRHLAEMEEELQRWGSRATGALTFIPHLVPVHRGILLTIVFQLDRPIGREECLEIYRLRYGKEPFIRIRDETPESAPQLRSVVGSNRIELAPGVDPRSGRGWVLAALDNLGKGAAGQAVQVLNLRFGWEERTGLDPYPIAFA